MRLVTRADLDGLACAVLIAENESIDGLLLAHPQEIADGDIAVGSGDILANLPFREGCSLWFDHHLHTSATPPTCAFEGAFGRAPSAARLVYDYYGGRAAMPQYEELVRETDRLDSADLSLDDILDPAGYIKLGFTLDRRSGLGPIDDYFRIVYRLLAAGEPIGHVLEHPEVARRCDRLELDDVDLHTALQAHSEIHGNVLLTDFRSLDEVPVGNRFLVFALFPRINVALRAQLDPDSERVALSLGHSIVNRTCRSNLGEIAARYGGGGHPGAASLQLMDEPDQQIRMIVAELKANG